MKSEIIAELARHAALLPQDWPDVMAMVESGKRIKERHWPDEEDGLAIVALSDEDRANVQVISAALSPDNALFDVSQILYVVSFLAQHPELWAALKTLLMGKKS